MKFTLIVLVCVFILSLMYVFFLQQSLSKRYLEVNSGDSKSVVEEKMGKPKQVEKNYQNASAENWNYYSWPFPRVYTLVISGDEVIDKYDSISP